MSSSTAGSSSQPAGTKPANAMKQSLLAFKPRTSSNLAVQASSSPAGSSSLDGMNDDNIDSDIATPPSQNHNGIDDSSHRQDVDMSSTPPRASHHDLTNGNDTVASASYVTVDDSDGDDLSDPPPLLTPAAAKPKLLTKKRPASTTNGGTTAKKPKKTNVKGQDDSQTDVHVPRRIAAPGQSALCHHHRAVCPGPLLRCTHIRSKGERCTLKYCERAFDSIYKIDKNAILAKGRSVTDDVDPAEHCPDEEDAYFFKCPRCAGTCQCSVCRKRQGLPPLGPAKGPKGPKDAKPEKPAKAKKADGVASSSVKAKASASSSSSSAAPTKKPKSEAKAASGDPVKKASKAKTEVSSSTKAKGKAAATGNTDAKGKGKGKAKQHTAANGKSAAKPLFKAKGKDDSATAALKSWKTARQTALPRPLKAPAPVAAPELEVIPTKLQRENFDARVWIYETLVRFEFIKVPKAILSQLDKFDLWTHRQVQMLLERILVALAGVHSISSGQPKAGTTESVKAYRKYGDDLTRGEPWQSAKLLCEASKVDVPTLPHVDRIFEDESKEPPVTDSGPTLLSSRSTRARRAAEVKALERVKLQSLRDMDKDFDSDSEVSDEPPRGRGQRARSRVDYSFVDDGDEEDVDDAEEEEAPRRSGRQTARQVSMAQNGRNASPEGVRRSGRSTRGAIAVETSPDESDEEGSRDRADASVTASARSSARAESEAGTRASEGPSAATADGGGDTTPVAVEPPKEAEPVPAPEMEEKVAILVGLLEAVMQTSAVGDELKAGAARLPEIEKGYKDDLKELEKEWSHIKHGLSTDAPSISQAEQFAKWKKDKEKKERDFKLRILDAKVDAYRQTEANKIRTGPLGIDADGREFWQLTEFNETMPAHTAGRWAWCVLVYGERMTKHAPLPSAMPNNASNVSPLKAFAGEAGGDVNGDVKMEAESDVKPTPARDGFTTPPRDVGDADADDGKVFMGTNYPPSIKEVISFLKYRCLQLDYEELRAQRDAEEAAQAGATDGDTTLGSPSASGSGSASVGFSRKAKRQLKEAQEERKRRVDELCEKLEGCRRYYLWHGGEVDEGDPSGMF